MSGDQMTIAQSIYQKDPSQIHLRMQWHNFQILSVEMLNFQQLLRLKSTTQVFNPVQKSQIKTFPAFDFPELSWN